MLLDCHPAPALVLPAPGWQVAEQAHAASAQEQRLLRLALTHYTPAQAASRLGVRTRQLGQVVPPYTTRVHYRRDEVDALAAQGQKVSLASLCRRAQVTEIVTAVYQEKLDRTQLSWYTCSKYREKEQPHEKEYDAHVSLGIAPGRGDRRAGQTPASAL